MRSASVGRVLAVVFFGASVVSGCGGRSDRFDGDEASAGEASGGSGAAPAGGAGAGGRGAGGVIVFGGAGGTGGTGATAPCGECPPGDYGLSVEGDGAPYEMAYNGEIVTAQAELPGPPPPPPECPERPLRGTVAGCGRSISLGACAGPMSTPPCLEVRGKTARYVDRQGLLWGGAVTSDVPAAYAPGISGGTLTIDLTDPTASFSLTVTYSFCSPLGVLDIPC